MSIAPKYLNFDELINKKLFRIPGYQRYYSWTKRQRQDLFNDIEKLSMHPDKERVHFMATVVCYKRPQREEIITDIYEVLDVVDGQQRLTTLIIIIKAISKFISKEYAAKYCEVIKSLESSLVKDNKRLLLLHNDNDSSIIFRDYLVDGTIPDVRKAKTFAESNLIDAFIECEKFVERCDIKFGNINEKVGIIELLKIIKNRMFFLLHILEDEGAVYTLFEVLNSRGLEVDWLDKCKSILLGIAFERFAKETVTEHINEIQKYWRQIYSTIGIQNISGSEILRYAATLNNSTEQRRLLNEESSIELFRGLCNQNIHNVYDISKWLLDVTLELKGIYSNIRLKAVSKISHSRLLVIAVSLADYLSDNERNKILEQWERVTFRIYGICGKDSRTKVGDYVSLACRIRQNSIPYEQIMNELISIGSDKEFTINEAVKNLQEVDCYSSWDDDLRYFLFRYEEYLSKQRRIGINEAIWEEIWRNSPNDTIEHIYPQTESQAWKGKIRSTKKALQANRLGNLMLLPFRYNREAGNKSFVDKKDVYNNSGLLLVREVIIEDDWDLERIKLREDRLLEWAKVAWDNIEI